MERKEPHPSQHKLSLNKTGLVSKGPPDSKLFRHLIPTAARPRFMWTEELGGGEWSRDTGTGWI